jgi:DNA polymerase III gamma/tau subunit
LEHIVREEGIRIRDDAKEYLLDISQGSVRNVINHLEKMWILDMEITIDLCKQLCFNIPFFMFELYVAELKKGGGLRDAITVLYKINNEMGYSVIDILDEFFIFIKMTELLTEEQKYKIVPIICEYIMHFHLVHEDAIELALLTKCIFDVMGV